MGATEKISITIGSDELRHAKRLATRLGLSLSTFISDAVRDRIEEQARREAAREVLATFEPEDRATPQEVEALLVSWSPPKSKRPRRPRARSARGSR
jgi:hypothetical protein